MICSMCGQVHTATTGCPTQAVKRYYSYGGLIELGTNERSGFDGHVGSANDYAILQDKFDVLLRQLTEVKAERDAALEWTEDDKPIPEDADISAAHPLRTQRHDLYHEALRMVGAKRSKGALVDLVNWLLSRAAIPCHTKEEKAGA